MEFIAKNKKKIIAFIVIAILAVLTGMTCFANMNKRVDISYDTNSGANGSVQTKSVTGKTQLTVRDLLTEEGYTVDENQYSYSVDLDAKVRNVSEVNIKQKVSGSIEVDGQKIVFTSSSGTVGDVLNENNIALGTADLVTPATAAALTTDVSNIKVTRVTTKDETRTESIAFATQEVQNADLAKGSSEVTTLGENGVSTITDRVTYKDGNETERVNISSEVTKEPINQVVQIGTKVTTTSEDVITETSLPFSTETKENADLDEGVKNILTKGVNGSHKLVVRVTYEDGVEVSRETISDETTNPVNEVIEVGTKKAVVEESKPSEPEPTPTPDTETPTETPEDNTGDSGNSGGNATESINPSDFDLICAIVAHEGGTSYEGAMGVISCVMNRVDSGAWGGSDAVSVLTAPGQFASYLDGYYRQYLGADIPEVRQAVKDCMENGVRSHSYTSFRSYQTSGSVNICGNWYF